MGVVSLWAHPRPRRVLKIVVRFIFNIDISMRGRGSLFKSRAALRTMPGPVVEIPVAL